ncbi:MAG TPA: hypothetical protein VGD14_22825, partial [bacterium]
DQPSDETEKKREKQVSIQILDSADQVIRKFDGPMKKGLNRAFWDLCREGFQLPSVTGRVRGFSPPGPEILPGKYKVKIKMGDYEATQAVEVLPDPRVTVPMEERKQKYEALVQVGERIEIVTEAVEQIRKMEKSVDVVLERIKDNKDHAGINDKTDLDESKELKKSGGELKKRLKKVLQLFVDEGGKQGITREDNVSRKLWYVSNSLGSSWDKPTASQVTYLRQAEEALKKALDEYNNLFEKDVVEFQQKVKQSNFTIFPAVEKLDMKWRRRSTK